MTDETLTTIETVTPDELEVGDDTSGIDRKVAFETDNNTMVHALVAGGRASGWHHHADRHVYGYVIEGTVVFEYGPGGSDRKELEAGDFFHIEPRTIHRDVNPADEEQWLIINFVGSGPLVKNVDGPAPA